MRHLDARTGRPYHHKQHGKVVEVAAAVVDDDSDVVVVVDAGELVPTVDPKEKRHAEVQVKTARTLLAFDSNRDDEKRVEDTDSMAFFPC